MDKLMFREAVRNLRAYPTKAEKPCRIDLASNENPYGPSQRVMAALRGAIEQGRANRYPDPSNRRLREELARFHGLEPENFVVFHGLEEGLYCVTQACLGHGEETLTYWPSFEIYRKAAQMMEANFMPVVLEPDFSYTRRTERQIIDKITEQTALVTICNPNNPTGTAVPIRSIRNIAQAAREIGIAVGRKDGIAVLVDEAYFEFDGETALGYLYEFPNLIVGRTFSKAYDLAGKRVGYAMTGDPENAAILQKLKPTFSVDEESEMAAIAALQDQDYMRNTVAKILSERERLAEELPMFGLRVYPSATNFLLVDVSPMGMNRDQFVNALLETAEIKVRGIPLEGFDGQYVRITVGTQDENTELLTAIEGITKPHKEMVDLVSTSPQ